MATQLKIIIMGQHGVGKTSLIHRYSANEFYENTDDLLKTEFMEKSLTVDDRKISAALWDPAAFTSGTGINESFYERADGCCLVFSTIDQESFKNLRKYYEDVVQRCSDDICFVFAENKIDLIDQSVIDSKEVESLAKQHKFRLYRISAKENHNVDDLFQYLIEKCLKTISKKTSAIPRSSSHNCLDIDQNQTDQLSVAPVERSQSAEPSKRRTGGVKPVFNRHKCPMM